jgi:nucleoside phosphorylase
MFCASVRRQVLADGGELDVKNAMRTGTLLTTDNRDWELRAQELMERFKQSRAVGACGQSEHDLTGQCAFILNSELQV